MGAGEQEEEITGALKTALTSRKGLYQYKTDVSEDALKHIANMCGGDLRAAYNALELAVVTTQPQSDGTVRVTLEDAEQSIQRKALSYNEVCDSMQEKRKIYATARGYGDYKGQWEFPGGKIEPGETPQQALKREIEEELDTEITVGDLIGTIEYDYPAFHLSMDCFWCEVVSGGSDHFGCYQKLNGKEKVTHLNFAA